MRLTPGEMVIKEAKRLLHESAANPSDSEWRKGHVETLIGLLAMAGINARYAPATYEFDGELVAKPRD